MAPSGSLGLHMPQARLEPHKPQKRTSIDGFQAWIVCVDGAGFVPDAEQGGLRYWPVGRKRTCRRPSQTRNRYVADLTQGLCGPRIARTASGSTRAPPMRTGPVKMRPCHASRCADLPDDLTDGHVFANNHVDDGQVGEQ